MSDYQLMEWAPVKDAHPKVAQAVKDGRQYVIWDQPDGWQVAQRTVGGMRQIKLHQQAFGLPSIAHAITLAEQWAWAHGNELAL
jgi:hypothetical protein